MNINVNTHRTMQIKSFPRISYTSCYPLVYYTSDRLYYYAVIFLCYVVVLSCSSLLSCIACLIIVAILVVPFLCLQISLIALLLHYLSVYNLANLIILLLDQYVAGPVTSISIQKFFSKCVLSVPQLLTHFNQHFQTVLKIYYQNFTE